MSMNVPAAASRIFQEFKKDLFATAEATPVLWPKIATEVPSRSRSTLHAWVANSNTVREWLGPRIAKNLSSRTWEIVNRSWELTYEFTREQMEDDLEGLVQSAIMSARDQGQQWAQHADKLIADTVQAGISTVCHDGQFYFDTDHPIDPDGVVGGTFDNDLALALTHANFNTAYTTMLSFKNENDMPMVMPGSLVLMVPPALSLQAKQIVAVDTLTPTAAYGLLGSTGASTNPLFGMAEMFVNPYLTDTTRWYLLGSRGVMKPFVFQRRKELEIEEQGPGSAIWFAERKMQIGGYARYEASYTLPQLAITSKP